MALLGKKEEKTNVPLLGRREDESVATRPGEVHTLLGKGSEFEGKLTFEGQVRIDGKFNGQIVTKDVLVIGDGARVTAEINAGHSTIRILLRYLDPIGANRNRGNCEARFGYLTEY